MTRMPEAWRMVLVERERIAREIARRLDLQWEASGFTSLKPFSLHGFSGLWREVAALQCRVERPWPTSIP